MIILTLTVFSMHPLWTLRSVFFVAPPVGVRAAGVRGNRRGNGTAPDASFARRRGPRVGLPGAGGRRTDCSRPEVAAMGGGAQDSCRPVIASTSACMNTLSSITDPARGHPDGPSSSPMPSRPMSDRFPTHCTIAIGHRSGRLIHTYICCPAARHMSGSTWRKKTYRPASESEFYPPCPLFVALTVLAFLSADAANCRPPPPGSRAPGGSARRVPGPVRRKSAHGSRLLGNWHCAR
jgi:hypothetical protein